MQAWSARFDDSLRELVLPLKSAEQRNRDTTDMQNTVALNVYSWVRESLLWSFWGTIPWIAAVGMLVKT